MDKQQFLIILQKKLYGVVSDLEVRENMQYYEEHIEQEIRQGKTEQEVISALGDPRLIAKSIIEASYSRKGNGRKKQDSDNYAWQNHGDFSDDQDSDYNQKEYSMGDEKGFHAKYESGKGMDIRYGKFRFNSWYGRLLLISLLVLFLVLVMLIVGRLLILAFYLIIPVTIIGFVFYTIKKFEKK